MFVNYIIRFFHNDSSEIEEQGFTTAEEAWEVFRLFAEPDSADIYSRVELAEYSRVLQAERTLAALEFRQGV